MPLPVPDRSKRQRRATKDDEGVLDIGWAAGTLKDGRPYFAELWAQDQVTSVTVFFSRQGLEDLGSDEACTLLEDEGLLRFGPKRYCSAQPCPDDAGEPMWSVNLVVGDDEETFLAGDSFGFRRYGTRS
jgi:hypothetical protein